MLRRWLLLLSTSPAPFEPFLNFPRGDFLPPVCLAVPLTPGDTRSFSPSSARRGSAAPLWPSRRASILPGRQASLTRTPLPTSLLNPYCCLGERVGPRDSREQSRRGHDLAIITLPWGREGSSLGFQSPFESVLYVLYIKHLSGKKTQSPGKRTRSHIFSSWTSALITGYTGWQHEGGA